MAVIFGSVFDTDNQYTVVARMPDPINLDKLKLGTPLPCDKEHSSSQLKIMDVI